jgi:hypothetical protein
MSLIRLGPAVLALGFGVLPARAADLTRIDRTIAKEPRYQTQTPKYCLLVFGPEARTRVWLVLDGHVLYVDRNCDGDLTDPTERVPSVSRWTSGGEIVEPDGKTRHTNLRMMLRREGNFVLQLEVEGKCLHYVGSDDEDRLRFADSPQDAPIVHFGGPLTFRLYEGAPTWFPGLNTELNVSLGTPGLGKGSFAIRSCCTLPKGVYPVADIEFPARNPDDGPITAKVKISED